ncbi:BACON domain-containing protein [uncultured Alistipes sp.]|uniref:BACON domain-containing protein n=1 Tax=uncultured Alistipes sp. TaxID=538949 RepID=UPI0025E6BCE1|nr:BACON domain-containing protein [uncultured Alistipes sp.]
MSKVIQRYDGYMMLLDALYFQGLRMGNISEEGITWEGEEAQTLELWAAQIRTSPVKEVMTRAATNLITGKMIECVAPNLKALLGGKVTGERWDAPATSMIQEGELKILTGTGTTIDIRRATLRTAQMRGGLGGENTLGVDFGLKMLTPLDGGSPYAIYPTLPFIEADVESLQFPAEGGAQEVNIEASGLFAVGSVPDGFSVEIINGRVTILAEENTSASARTGAIDFILEADISKKVTIDLTQAAA